MGLSLVLAGASWVVYLLVVRRRFSTLSDAAAAAFLLAVTQIIVTARVLALLGRLQLGPLLLVNLLLPAGLLLLLAVRRQVGASARAIWSRLAGFLRLLAGTPLALFLAAALVAAMAWVLWQAAILPEASYDGLAYHLPIALSRVQFGDMRVIPAWPMWISSYPEHSELLMAWSALLDGSAVLMDAVQWAFWPAALVTLYALARKLDIAPISAFLGSTLFGFAPVVLLQAQVAYNDLIVAALFLIALNLLIDRRVLSTALAGTALGLLAGIKYAGVVFSIVSGVALLLTDPPWKRRNTFWPRLLALALPVLVLGGAWYVVNWVVFRNPIWPFTVRIGDMAIFRGVFSARALYSDALAPEYRQIPSVLLAPFFWLEPTAAYHYEARYNGLGLLWPALGIPAFLYLLSAFRRLRGPALTVVLIGLGGAFALTPYNWLVRYTLSILGLGALGVAWVLHAGTPWVRRLARAVLVLGVVYAVWTAGPLTMVSPGRLDAAAHLPVGLRAHIDKGNSAAYRWLDENSYDGTRVVYGLGVYFIAPLWESDLDNQVLYVEQRIPEFWHPEVARLQAQYVFVEKHPLNAWIGSTAGWDPVYTDDQFTIYRVEPMELQR
jgi:hypothetical protein